MTPQRTKDQNVGPKRTQDLSSTERALLHLMQDLRFGQLECLRVVGGRLVESPHARQVKHIKFGSATPELTEARDFDLRFDHIEFFRQLRSLGDADIRRIEIRHGIPCSMELDQPLPFEVLSAGQ